VQKPLLAIAVIVRQCRRSPIAAQKDLRQTRWAKEKESRQPKAKEYQTEMSLKLIVIFW
jgi:hypothetical protein